MKLSRQDVPFTMVANEVLSSKVISWGAKGIFGYMFSKPEGWDFSADRIANEGIGERKMILRFIKELEAAGLLSKKKLPSGRMEYMLRYSEPKAEELTMTLFSQSTKSGLRAKVPKRHGGDMVLISNKEGESKKDISIAGEAIASPMDTLNELIDEFKVLNPSYRRFFANKTQRAALTRVVQSIGFEKARGAIRAAVASFGKPYAPTITTPAQLEDRLASLAAFVKKNGTEASVFSI